MNRLQLCQRTQQEAGTSQAISTTIGQTGMSGQVVAWVDSAYEDIQNQRGDWNFLLNEFTFPAIIGTATYSKASALLPELGRWKADTLRIYLDSVDDEQWLDCREWWAFRDSRLMGSNRTATGRPTEFAIKADKAITLWPVPDAEYTVVGEYYKRAQTMTANATEPLIPVPFQMAIVWRAVMFFAADQESPSLYNHAKIEFSRLYCALEIDQLPAISEVL